ncbi:MAG TPA: nascent polypeptide-associated complex protein [Candidatus Nanoarchaeia archaeon]|nr:nascent polypeptide-associated complex protein [Candidatus Nanoarchaeia archaeon]
MFPNINPKKMQAVMKQMGISQEDIDASRVIIEKPDNTKIVINSPSVTKINMHGQETFQIAGDITEESADKFSQEDIETIMEKTGSSEELARQTLEEVDGDLAEAILRLSE